MSVCLCGVSASEEVELWIVRFMLTVHRECIYVHMYQDFIQGGGRRVQTPPLRIFGRDIPPDATVHIQEDCNNLYFTAMDINSIWARSA